MHLQYLFSDSQPTKNRTGRNNQFKSNWADAVDKCYRQGQRPANSSDNFVDTTEKWQWTGIIAFSVIYCRCFNTLEEMCTHNLLKFIFLLFNYT